MYNNMMTSLLRKVCNPLFNDSNGNNDEKITGLWVQVKDASTDVNLSSNEVSTDTNTYTNDNTN